MGVYIGNAVFPTLLVQQVNHHLGKVDGGNLLHQRIQGDGQSSSATADIKDGPVRLWIHEFNKARGIPCFFGVIGELRGAPVPAGVVVPAALSLLLGIAPDHIPVYVFHDVS
jgi:hypothetical protein